MSPQMLQQLTIQFKVANLPDVLKALADVQKATVALQASMQAVAVNIGSMVSKGLTAFGALVAGGIAASHAGQVLGLQFQQLSLQVASLFTPEILRLSQALGRLIDWLRSLSGEQQRAIARFVEMLAVLRGMRFLLGMVGLGTGGLLGGLLGLSAAALVSQKGFEGLFAALEPVGKLLSAAILPVLTAIGNVLGSINMTVLETSLRWLAWSAAMSTAVLVISRIVTAIGSMVRALVALRSALAVVMALSGPKGWAMLAASAAVAAAAIGTFAALDAAAARSGGPAGTGTGHSDLAPRGSVGFTSLDAIYSSLVQASLLGKNVPEQQLDTLRQIHSAQQQTNQILQNQRPAVAP